MIKNEGRLIYKQHKGGISFWTVRCQEKHFKLLIEKDKINNYDNIKDIKIGSLISFQGVESETAEGRHEHVIRVNKISITLSYKGNIFVTNQNSRHTNRVVRLLKEPFLFDYFNKTLDIPFYIRGTLYGKGFREVNTGILQSYFEGGSARPYITHHYKKNYPLYLSMTSELKLARLLIAGFEKLFEITQSFRNEGLSFKHAIEYSVLEISQTNTTGEELSKLVEEIVRNAIRNVYPDGKTMFNHKANIHEIDYNQPFKNISYYNALAQFTQYDGKGSPFDWLVEHHPDEFNNKQTTSTWVKKTISKFIAPNIFDPTFITDLPSMLSPLIKDNPIKPYLSEKSILICQTLNLADIHSCENDYKTLLKKLKQQSIVTKGKINQDFLDLVEMGAPKYAAAGISLNRLYMLFLGHLPYDVRETFLFPLK